MIIHHGQLAKQLLAEHVSEIGAGKYGCCSAHLLLPSVRVKDQLGTIMVMAMVMVMVRVMAMAMAMAFLMVW